MLVLCSNGLTSDAIIATLRPYVDRQKTAALVVTADPLYKENNYHVPRCIEELEELGLAVNVFDIDKTPCEDLEQYDVVEFIGGNPYYLLDSVRKHRTEPILQRIADSKLLIGWSAAAFVFGPSLSLVNEYTPEMNVVGLKDLSALKLTDIEVLPHYDRFLRRFEHFEETCAKYEADNDVAVVRLNDGDAVLIDESEVRVIRAGMNAIRWIFFDIGSTLVDEEEAYNHRIRDMIRGTSITFEQFSEKRIQYAKAGYNGDQKAIEYFALNKTPWHSEDEVPFDDCEETLRTLCDKGYQLGIIANQKPGAKGRLDAWGLGRYFSVIASSAEMGISKPKKEIFTRALAMADCKPENAVMVGDRLDNDIRPAKELGMKTIQIRKGIAVYANPSCGAEVPDFTVDSLSEILNIPCLIEELL